MKQDISLGGMSSVFQRYLNSRQAASSDLLFKGKRS